MTTEAEIHSWIAGYPRQWDQLCQALMWQLANRFGTVVSTPQSAIEAYYIEANAGRIQPGPPPNGAFFYYSIGQYGHVGFEMDNGHGFMATKKLIEEWTRDDAGWNTYDGYAGQTGARYLGWSWKNGGNSVPYTAGDGGGGGAVNYHWWELTADAMKALQQAGHRHGTYPTTSPDDGDFGELSVKSTQQILKDIGLLPADYEVDGIPHNPDQDAPSMYGYALQDLAITAGYDGNRDGLPGEYTSKFLVPAANALFQTPTPPDPEPPVVQIPVFPPAPAGFFFMPDIATSQGGFDFAEYVAHGGKDFAVKMGGGNASDSPYMAPKYQDQIQRGRNAGIQRAVHYWFNGDKNGLTPEASADYFAAHAIFSEGDIAAIDVEDEMNDDGTLWQRAWTPDEAVRYITQLRTHFPGINGLVYGSDSELDDPAWKPVWELGWFPWDASWGANGGDPGTPPTTSGEILMWQYTSKEKVPGNYSGNPKVYGDTDGNLARNDLFDLLGWVTPEPEPEPEPEPDDAETRAVLKEYLLGQAKLAQEQADKL